MAKIPQIIVCNGHGLGEYCDVKRIPNPGETCIAYNRRFEMDAGKGTMPLAPLEDLAEALPSLANAALINVVSLVTRGWGSPMWTQLTIGWFHPLNRA